MDYTAIHEVEAYNLSQRLSEILKKKFTDNISAVIELSNFLMMANVLGHRGQYAYLKVDGNRIVQK